MNDNLPDNLKMPKWMRLTLEGVHFVADVVEEFLAMAVVE
jgi:hypothetical protein